MKNRVVFVIIAALALATACESEPSPSISTDPGSDDGNTDSADGGSTDTASDTGTNTENEPGTDTDTQVHTDPGTDTETGPSSDTDTGSGSDTGCDDDLSCPEEQFCDPATNTCIDDVCDPGRTRCDQNRVMECESSGGGWSLAYLCESQSYFVSECSELTDDEASCRCEDDWDCPPFTVCEAGACTGTGEAPTCTLPPVDFSEVPPALELHWGSDSRTATAHDGTVDANPVPWPTFKHVLNTPVVANLDDDNGDGVIDELDFPEIIFTSLAGNTPWTDGVLRAIHGGGPNKGADYFSRCGDLLWKEGMDLPSEACASAQATADSGTPVLVADLDYDGVPEIVVPRENDPFQILDNQGEVIYTLPAGWPKNPLGETISAVNLDHAGYAELVMGRNVFVLGDHPEDGRLIVTHALSGTKSSGANEIGSMACPADLKPERAGIEIAAGTTLYALPETLPECDTPPCTGALEVLWYAPDIDAENTLISAGATDGFCAVADIWGADPAVSPGPENPPDGTPEVILISNGHLVVLEGNTGALIKLLPLGGMRGGAPNIDDFDGDGFMEVASALQDKYIVVDLQDPEETNCPAWDQVLPRVTDGENPNLPGSARNPGDACTTDGDCSTGAVCKASGSCVCLHNGWKRGNDDSSSRATSSSVFDFNGDGSAEVVYNDECELRVYSGLDGKLLYNIVSRSRTGIENPIVADVDNDGNAEIVTISNNAVAGRCTVEGAAGIEGVNGVRVFGDPTDTWVSARRIWNQQSYHVTNVTESAGIPPHEAESWRVLSGRSYNTYRSQPRTYGVAPDLEVTGIQVSSPDAACGELSSLLDIAVRIENKGDLRVGPGVVVSFYGEWTDTSLEEALHADNAQTPLTATISSSLEPGASLILTVHYDSAHNSPGVLPDKVRAIVDQANKERECNESNNDMTTDVDPGSLLPDLTIDLGAVSAETCPEPTVETTVTNLGSAPASNIVVRYYAGNPDQGGKVLDQTIVPGPLAAKGGTTTFAHAVKNFPKENNAVLIWGWVDPDNKITECNDGNNRDFADDKVTCVVVPR